eukprot:12847840-Ditylum_brightwellii.AAC.1
MTIKEAWDFCNSLIFDDKPNNDERVYSFLQIKNSNVEEINSDSEGEDEDSEEAKTPIIKGMETLDGDKKKSSTFDSKMVSNKTNSSKPSPEAANSSVNNNKTGVSQSVINHPNGSEKRRP